MSTARHQSSRAASRDAASLVPHREASRIPVMDEVDFRAFQTDIARRGIIVPLEIKRDGVVLDGRQRLRAARELGLRHVPVRVVAPENEFEYMLKAALLRRQLTPSQRAALLVESEAYGELKDGARVRQRANLRQSEVATLPPRGKTRELAAPWASVSARTLQDAETVHMGDPELFERLKRGDVSASQAARRVRRAFREKALPPAPPLPSGPFEVIYADPPWQLGNPDGPWAPENHYPTMPLADIKALRVPAADDAVLFLWTVTSLLPQALEVIEAWGFQYKTELIWDKCSIGPGGWLRNQHEPLLIARRGAFPPPDEQDRVPSVVRAPRGRHSQKPDCVYELIERMYAHASKVEFFARATRPGWVAWGNEVPE